MTRSAASSGTVQTDARRPRPRDTSRRPRLRHTLDDLTAATEIHRRFGEGERLERVAPGVAFSALAALAVGAAIALAGGFEYRSTALMQLENPSPAAAAALRLRLNEFVLEQTAAQEVSFAVESPAADLLRLSVVASDRQAATEAARTLAESFMTTLDESAARPGPRELWLKTRLDDLHDRLNAAEQRVIDSIARTSLENPGQRRDELLARWREGRTEFEAAREALRSSALHLRELKAQPAPTRASVRAEVRADAIASDESLQQDLAQLTAELADLRSVALEDWQATAPVVDELNTTAQRFIEVIAAALRRTTNAGLQVELELIQIEAEAYEDRVTAFSEVWTQQFLTLKSLQPQPLSGELFDLLGRVESIQSEFLFHAGKTLSNLQTRTRDLGGGEADSRLHVLESDVVRGRESLRDVHDRFSLLVSRRPSLSVDAALRTSRRLDRRVRDAVALIDEKLAAEALERATKEHARVLAEAEVRLQDARLAYDDVATHLIEMQDDLNVSSDLTADFLRESLAAEFASLHLQDVVREVDKTEREMSALRSERVDDAAGQGLRLRQVAAADAPANLASQLRLGGLGAALTFAVSMLSQWRLLRRRR